MKTIASSKIESNATAKKEVLAAKDVRASDDFTLSGVPLLIARFRSVAKVGLPLTAMGDLVV
jgi:hypothetical protein